jgi:hypothetical protein
MELVSSKQSEEIKARAGIAVPNRNRQFAPNEDPIVNCREQMVAQKKAKK